MEKLKKVLLFCNGDANLASTWSNIPYLLKNSLEKLNIEVIPVNISINRYVNKLIDIAIRANKVYNHLRTPIHRNLVERKIKKAVNQHKDADFCVFLNFDFINRYNNIPSLVFSDWTYEIFLKRKNHIPTKREQKFIIHQNKILTEADIVLPLFSESFEIIQRQLPSSNLVGINRNVINLLDSRPFDLGEIIEKKNKSNNILFIGRENYREGLDQLLAAIDKLDNVVLNVIGIEGANTETVKYHGWLKKDNPADNKLYYDLMREARIIVNTTSGWSGYSALIEAMYYGTPLIVFPFVQFTKEFGETIDFGFFSEGETTDLTQKIKSIINADADTYEKMSKSAHEQVKEYTWENYARDIIDIMESSISGNLTSK